MTEAESKQLKEYWQAAAKILCKDTPKEQLRDFSGIELAVREHILTEVAPEIGNFFKREQQHRSG
jgi:hypothetical protein